MVLNYKEQWGSKLLVEISAQGGLTKSTHLLFYYCSFKDTPTRTVELMCNNREMSWLGRVNQCKLDWLIFPPRAQKKDMFYENLNNLRYLVKTSNTTLNDFPSSAQKIGQIKFPQLPSLQATYQNRMFINKQRIMCHLLYNTEGSCMFFTKISMYIGLRKCVVISNWIIFKTFRC